MPVLVTIATINLLFRGGDSVGFLEPESLRARCHSVLTDPETRSRALALVGRLEEVAGRYDANLKSVIESYRTATDTSLDARKLVQSLEPQDRVRRETLLEIVSIRQSMREMLSEAEWTEVFG